MMLVYTPLPVYKKLEKWLNSFKNDVSHKKLSYELVTRVYEIV